MGTATDMSSEKNVRRVRRPDSYQEIKIIIQVSSSEWQTFLPSFGLYESNDKQKLIDMLNRHGYGHYLKE